MSVNIAVNHQDKRASHGQLIRDLAIYSHSSQEQKSRLRPRLREEIHTLLTCPQASHAEVIEGILMQRSFGSLRAFISRHHRRRDGTCRSTQTVDYAVSRFLGIPELLETMLSHLPARSVMSSTRVSKIFPHLIYNAPTLLEKLFLRPQEAFESVAFAGLEERSPNNHRKQRGECRIATLCPLLHMNRQSELAFEERFESKDHEVAAIDLCAARADSCVQTYLTNPPFVEVELVYKGTSFRSRYTVEETKPGAKHTI